jgi:hypothetical protein
MTHPHTSNKNMSKLPNLGAKRGNVRNKTLGQQEQPDRHENGMPRKHDGISAGVVPIIYPRGEGGHNDKHGGQRRCEADSVGQVTHPLVEISCNFLPCFPSACVPMHPSADGPQAPVVLVYIYVGST